MRRLLLLAGLASATPMRAHAQTPIAPALIDYAVNALARLIETTRERTIAEGVRPIPPAVYRGLLGYFPAAFLQRVRFASGRGNGSLSLPTVAFTYGDAVAMTLGDVVIFRDDHAAQTDLKLWAHELTHVMQYQRWGMDGFARHYITDRAAVEKEAVENARRFVAWQRTAQR
ncbi:MAG: DUF4157 domain-containing protein [Acetobacteraceae bacterium]